MQESLIHVLDVRRRFGKRARKARASIVLRVDARRARHGDPRRRRRSRRRPARREQARDEKAAQATATMRRQAREARRGEAAQSRRRGVDQGGVSLQSERDVERGAGRVFRRARREDRGATTRDGGEEGKATGAALVGVRIDDRLRRGSDDDDGTRAVGELDETVARGVREEL